jgi:hypothetical protein
MALSNLPIRRQLATTAPAVPSCSWFWRFGAAQHPSSGSKSIQHGVLHNGKQVAASAASGGADAGLPQ